MIFLLPREHKSNPIIIKNSSLGPLVQTDVADILSKAPNFNACSARLCLNIMLSVPKSVRHEGFIMTVLYFLIATWRSIISVCSVLQ